MALGTVNVPPQEVDSALSSTSTNPIENKVVYAALAKKSPTDHTHSAATTSAAGLMSAADKTNLESVSTNLDSHKADTVSHITASERSTWNSKAAGSHTHNYAGSSSAGGAANTVKAIEGTANVARNVWFSDSSQREALVYSEKFKYNPYTDTLTVGTVSGNLSGNATTATKLQTARTIALSDGATGTATSFNGSANISIPVTAVKESYLSWGGKNFSGSFSPVDAALISELNANRFAGLPNSCFTFERSSDGGSTWSTYSNSTGTDIVTTSGSASNANTTSSQSAKNWHRITIDANGKFYGNLKKLAIHLSTNGATGAGCKLEYGDYSSTTVWTTSTSTSVSGWSGWNIINTDRTVGSSSYGSTRYVRLTFYQTGVNSNYPSNLIVYRIRAYTTNCWTAPSNLASHGQVYNWDSSFNVSFPAKVTAPTFVGALSGNASSASKASSATKIANLYSSRPTSANLTPDGSGGVVNLKATSSMTTGKPKADGHILHFYWDNSGGWDAQLSIPTAHNAPAQWRAMSSGTWCDWKSLLDNTNYTDYTVTKTGSGASGTWGINISGNAATSTKLGSSTVGGAAKPIYLNAGTATACSSTVGSATQPVYMNGGTITAGSTYAGGTAVTLNGSSKAASTASIYAPTSAGTSGYILKSSGSGAPAWLATLPIANGGTGKTTASASLYALINGCSALNATSLASTDYIAIGDVSAGTGKKVTVSDLASCVSASSSSYTKDEIDNLLKKIITFTITSYGEGGSSGTTTSYSAVRGTTWGAYRTDYDSSGYYLIQSTHDGDVYLCGPNGKVHKDHTIIAGASYSEKLK